MRVRLKKGLRGQVIHVDGRTLCSDNYGARDVGYTRPTVTGFAERGHIERIYHDGKPWVDLAELRRFVKGDMGLKSELACRLSGSSDMYRTNARKPYHSLNFVTAHDGFTLRDLVSYNDKHNDANGEQNRDGCNDNDSWNHGGEGENVDDGVRALRWRQMKNFHLALMVSQGCLLYTSPSPRDATLSRMPSSA